MADAGVRPIREAGAEARIDGLIAEMTLDEKVGMCAGSGPWHGTGVERLGIPALKVTDGPNGARGDGRSGATAACFPVSSALGATWNPALVEEVGRAIGQESKSKGAQVLLGPTVNLHRHPLGGRHFECYSEDPHLTAELAVSFVKGVQSEGVATSIKHFVANDTEFERLTISSDVDERPLHELYLVPFEAAVKRADTGSVMSAYNRVNGTYASSHEPLLKHLLKDEWGFDGFVVSDWGAARETVENARAGLDLEMPGPTRTRGDALRGAVEAGEVEEAAIDDMVRRILRVTFWSGRMDDPEEKEERSEDRPEHRALARRAAAEAMVLVKNERLLPLHKSTIKKLAVIGPNAERGRIQGGGSAGVRPHHESHPLAALIEELGDGVEVTHAVGCNIDKYLPAIPPAMLRPADGTDRPGLLLEYRNGSGFEGESVEARHVRRSTALYMGRFSDAVDPHAFTARYTGTFTPEVSGVHSFGLFASEPVRLFIDDELLIDLWDERPVGDAFFGRGSSELRVEIELDAGSPYLFRVEFEKSSDEGLSGLQFGMCPPQHGDPLAEAVACATAADAVVLVVGTNADWETEGNDRATLALPGEQDELVRRVIAANPNTVVVMNTGRPVSIPWLDEVPALIQSGFPGQEFGHALCDLLFGRISPSGRMPTTWPVRIEDTPAHAFYPGSGGHAPYGEGLGIGYRHYEASGIEPLIAFGHGCSYTEFAYGPLEMPERVAMGESVVVEVPIANAGEMTGQEVVQLYVHHENPPVERPLAELRAFAKIEIAPNRTNVVRFELTPRAFAYWDEADENWSVAPGRYEIRVGASARDIRSRAWLELTPR